VTIDQIAAEALRLSPKQRALLAESDLRTRETLAELAARLPGAGPVA